MIKQLNQYYNYQTFHPDFFSLFLNPSYIIRKELVKNIKRFAPMLSGKLIDIGCGLKPYQKYFTNASEYIGIDIENEGHDHTKENIDIIYDGKNIPFQENQFDSAFCSEVFEHVFDIDELITEIKRVLKKDGKLLITTPFVWDEHEIPNDFGRYTQFGLKHIFEKNGFEVIEITKTGHFISTISQLIILYFHYIFFANNKYLKMILNVLFISPLTITGVILSAIAPKNKRLYLNTIVLAKKK